MLPLFAEMGLEEATRALRQLHVEEMLLPVLIQLMVIIVVARIFGILARKIGQPMAVGEIVAGLILGPSLFQKVMPGIWAMIFRPHLGDVPQGLADAAFPKIFSILAQLGLIFLLFLIGMEFEFGHLKKQGRAALLISVMGIVLPFGLGALLAVGIHPYLEPLENTGKPVPLFGMTLFMGVAMSITAIPILGRMMMEMGITRTRLGSITITAAAIDDVVGWILLATVAMLARVGTEGFHYSETLTMVGLTLAFVAFAYFVMRPLLVRYFKSELRKHDGSLSLTGLVVLIVVLFLSATVTNLIGIFAIFGAFICGAVLSDQHDLRAAINERIRDLVNSFFLPIFFTYTGLQTNIGELAAGPQFLMLVGVLAAAIIGKFGGCTLAARVSGFPMRDATIIGVMMNTRALMELIVINAGRQLGVIPPSLYSMLVIMAVVTTIMTTPIMLGIRRGTEIEEPINNSGFLPGTRSKPSEQVTVS